MPRITLIDSCVLATFPIADLILRLAEDQDVWAPIWSSDILEEVERTHRDKLGWPAELADSFRNALEREFTGSMITDYRHLIPSLENNLKDRHVLAAAIKGKAEFIVTFNLRDFPQRHLKQWKVRAIHPQEFLVQIYDEDSVRVEEHMDDIVRRRNKGETHQDYLTGLSRFVPIFVDRIRSA